ncbi:MAG TPA: hypothetical protein DC057_14560, partial [Spirochaetia bacterium]|nr:hypothetical protein [Spirochaetia bacterium]
QGVKTMFETRLKEYGGRLKKEGKKEDAIKMLKKGFSIADIVDITDLSIEEIKSLRIPEKV